MGEAQAFCDGVQNPLIGLVWHHQRQVGRNQAMPVQQHLHAPNHLGHGKLEDHPSILFQEVLARGDRGNARREKAPPRRHLKIVPSTSVHPVMKVQDAISGLRGLE